LGGKGRTDLTGFTVVGRIDVTGPNIVLEKTKTKRIRGGIVISERGNLRFLGGGSGGGCEQ